MKNWIKRNIASLVFVGFFIALFLLFMNNGIEDKYFFGAIGALITLYIGTTRYQLQHDKMVMELFQYYNGKYDDELNDLFNRIRDNEQYQLTAEERVSVIDYINLCSEEYYWYKKGRIPQEIWESWKRGIEKNFEIKQIGEEVAKEKADSGDTYYSFFEDNEWMLSRKNPAKRIKP